MKPNQSRIVCRQAGAHESQNKTVKVATGKMEYNTRRFKREKSWKNYRLKQNK